MITAVKDPGALTGESRLRNLSNRMISAAPVKTLISQRCHSPKKLLEPWVRHPWSCCQDRLSRAGQQHLVTSAQTCSQMKHPCFHRKLVERGDKGFLIRQPKSADQNMGTILVHKLTFVRDLWSVSQSLVAPEKSDCRYFRPFL